MKMKPMADLLEVDINKFSGTANIVLNPQKTGRQTGQISGAIATGFGKFERFVF